MRAVEKPFDWKRSGTYFWKADFPLSMRHTRGKALDAAAGKLAKIQKSEKK